MGRGLRILRYNLLAVLSGTFQLTLMPGFNTQNRITFHSKLLFMNLIQKTLQSVSVYTKICTKFWEQIVSDLCGAL